MIHVLIVENHDLVRAGLRRLLEECPDINTISEVSNGEAALRFCREECPDIVLLDLALPELNGLDACEKIKGRHPDVVVMILSGYAQENYVLDALRVRALGYVLKSGSADELESAGAAILVDRPGEVAGAVAAHDANRSRRA